METATAPTEKQLTEGQWVLVEIDGGLADIETNVDAQLLKIDWDTVDDDYDYTIETIEMIAGSALPPAEKERLLNEVMRKWGGEAVMHVGAVVTNALKGVSGEVAASQVWHTEASAD